MKKEELRTAEDLEHSLYRHLRKRQLPDCFLYIGQSGAQNWLDLEHSDDFPVASRLTELLRRNADAIAESMPDTCEVVSIGTGDGQKERRLLEALLPERDPRFTAIDVSSGLVDEALDTVSELNVDAQGYVAFCSDLPELRPRWSSPFLLCLLGNNFCNYHPDGLLEDLSSELGPDDLLLFDAHLQPDQQDVQEEWRRRIRESYGSEQNARFNLWPLVHHGADPGACRFEIKLVQARTSAGPTCRTRKRIHILEPISLEIAGNRLELAGGEVVEMGFTYKFTLEHLHRLLDAHGWNVVDEFDDGKAENALLLAQAR